MGAPATRTGVDRTGVGQVGVEGGWAERLTFLKSPKQEVHEVLGGLLLEEPLRGEPPRRQSCAAHQDDAWARPVGRLRLAERLHTALSPLSA